MFEEQHQQLLRQQQLQRQQEQKSYYEQQQRVTAQQISPSAQHRSTAGFSGGQPNQQARTRSESERQRQDEQGYLSSNVFHDFINLFRLLCSTTSNGCPKISTTTTK